jgi:hypothetical protein
VYWFCAARSLFLAGKLIKVYLSVLPDPLSVRNTMEGVSATVHAAVVRFPVSRRWPFPMGCFLLATAVHGSRPPDDAANTKQTRASAWYGRSYDCNRKGRHPGVSRDGNLGTGNRRV